MEQPNNHLDDLNDQLGEVLARIAVQGLPQGELQALRQQAPALHARIMAEQQRVMAEQQRLMAEVQLLRERQRRLEQTRRRVGGGSDSGGSVDALERGRLRQQQLAGGQAGEDAPAVAAAGGQAGGQAGEGAPPVAAAAGQAGDEAGELLVPTCHGGAAAAAVTHSTQARQAVQAASSICRSAAHLAQA